VSHSGVERMKSPSKRSGSRLLAALMIVLAGATSIAAQDAAAEPPVAESLAAGSLETGSLATESAAAEVEATERAFARSMASRDFEDFQSFLSEEAVFFSGPTPLRGREAVAAGWRGFFAGPEAPFSWEPSAVEVLASGTLALSTGPVRDREGRVVATFTSIWRREPSGAWKIIFDRGCNACAEP
jgi:ketosteroid isomerase-like protein